MLSGVALSCADTGILVFGTEPSFQGADDAKRAYQSPEGARIPAVSSLTIADGLRTPVGAHPWSVIYERRLVAGFYSVTDAQIRRALRLVYERMNIVVEPSAAVPLAVALYDGEFGEWLEREVGGDDEEEGDGEGEGLDVGIVFSGR